MKRSRSLPLVSAVALALLTSACAHTAQVGTSSNGKTTIIVSAPPEGSSASVVDQFNATNARFEKAYPDVTINSAPFAWTSQTFAADLAGKTLPTLFTVPFTDARDLGNAGQVANLSPYQKDMPYFSQFNKSVSDEAINNQGQIIGIPQFAYVQALVFNRNLFKQAGLNPDNPPTTWAQVEADALQIHQKTGKTGYLVMGAQDDTAGWILTTTIYAMGGRLESGTGKNVKATLDTPQAAAALELYHKLRWVDNSMGNNMSYNWDDMAQQFAAGNIGMYLVGTGMYNTLHAQYQTPASLFGVTAVPLADSPTASAMGGGGVECIRPDAGPAEIKAAIEYVNFTVINQYLNKQEAVMQAKANFNGGVINAEPGLPMFGRQQTETFQSWIEQAGYDNFPYANAAGLTKVAYTMPVTAEPGVATQAVYHTLDPVVSAVLTNKNADIPALLKAAQAAAQQQIDTVAG